LINLKNISSPEPLAGMPDIWHGTSLGQGVSILFKWSVWDQKCPKGTKYDIGLYSKNL